MRLNHLIDLISSAERRASLEPLGLPRRDPPPLGYFGATNRVVTSAARVNPRPLRRPTSAPFATRDVGLAPGGTSATQGEGIVNADRPSRLPGSGPDGRK